MMSERDLCPPGMDRVDGGADPDSLRRAHDTTTRGSLELLHDVQRYEQLIRVG